MPSAIGTIKMPAIKECSNTKVGPNIKYTRVNKRAYTRIYERAETEVHKHVQTGDDARKHTSAEWDPGEEQVKPQDYHPVDWWG